MSSTHIFLYRHSSDALHLSIPAQGLPNGDAALQHAAYPGMQPYPGVGKFETLLLQCFRLIIKYYRISGIHIVFCEYSTFYFLCFSLTHSLNSDPSVETLISILNYIYHILVLCAVVLFPRIISSFNFALVQLRFLISFEQGKGAGEYRFFV